MKRYTIILIAALACSLSAVADEVKVVEKLEHLPVATAAEGRFEFIQAPSNYTKAFLLDLIDYQIILISK